MNLFHRWLHCKRGWHNVRYVTVTFYEGSIQEKKLECIACENCRALLFKNQADADYYAFEANIAKHLNHIEVKDNG